MGKLVEIVIIGTEGKYLETLKKDILKCLYTLNMKGNVKKITNIEDILAQNINVVPTIMINGSVVFEKEIPNTSKLLQTLKAV